MNDYAHPNDSMFVQMADLDEEVEDLKEDIQKLFDILWYASDCGPAGIPEPYATELQELGVKHKRMPCYVDGPYDKWKKKFEGLDSCRKRKE